MEYIEDEFTDALIDAICGELSLLTDEEDEVQD